MEQNEVRSLSSRGRERPQFAEKLEIQQPAPEGAVDFEELAVSLKRYPDTRPSFSANCKAVGIEGLDRSVKPLRHPRTSLMGEIP
jgi:hypothetical protein